MTTLTVRDGKHADLSVAAACPAGSRIVPSLTAAGMHSYGFQCVLAVEHRSMTRKYGLSPIGNYHTASCTERTVRGSVRTDIDSFYVKKDIAAAHLLFRLYAEDIEELLAAPLLACVSISGRNSFAEHIPVYGNTDRMIPVPVKSQMVLATPARRRICSPVCVSMVLDYYKRHTDALDVAARAYHPHHDMYGIWPANTWASSHYDVLAYVCRFTSFESAAELLDRNVPIIASIRYRRGELGHAALARTLGHLVVVRGLKGSCVVVNDPAGPDMQSVERLYDTGEFINIWLRRKGAGYVIVPREAVSIQEPGRVEV